MRLTVPAKVNLHLAVGRRRRDGYHSLVTLFHTVGLCDELVLGPARDLRFRASGLPSPAGSANLCVRAAALLRDCFAPGHGARIVLRKRIPAGAGLGGGSADAAATLAGLARLWKLRLPRRALAALAARLGSDVPFFLSGGAAVGKGRGERLTPVASRLRGWAVVFKPPFGISTRRAYAALDPAGARGREGTRTPLAAMLAAVRRGKSLPPVRNDFTAVACRMRPAIRRLLRALDAAGASPAFMTGSGSAVVGIFPSALRARRAARSLRRSARGFLAVVPLRPYRISMGRV